MRRKVRRGRRVVQWFLVGTGPLKRGTDRVEMAFRLFLLAALLAAAPVALMIGSFVHRHEAALAAREAEARHAVHAVLLADPQVPEGATPDAMVVTSVGWTTAQGKQRSATVPVPVTDREGDRVVVWLGPDGRVTDAPLDAATMSSNAVTEGFLAGAAVPLLAWCLLAAVRRVLNKRRARQWQADWSTVEPLWSSRGR